MADELLRRHREGKRVRCPEPTRVCRIATAEDVGPDGDTRRGQWLGIRLAPAQKHLSKAQGDLSRRNLDVFPWVARACSPGLE